MEELAQQIEALARQEQELQFSSFTNQDAWRLGRMMVDKAIREEKRIVIDIERHGQQLFHYAMEGTSVDNDQWVIRKKRVVNRFFKSSLLLALMLELSGKTIEERYGVSSSEYAVSGGSFPLIIKKVGVVGAITVSGMPHQEDHAYVVETIREFLNSSTGDRK